MTPGIISGRNSPEVELSTLRAEIGVLRRFKERVEAEWAEPGAITKAEIRLALDETNAALKVLGT